MYILIVILFMMIFAALTYFFVDKIRLDFTIYTVLACIAWPIGIPALVLIVAMEYGSNVILYEKDKEDGD